MGSSWRFLWSVVVPLVFVFLQDVAAFTVHDAAFRVPFLAVNNAKRPSPVSLLRSTSQIKSKLFLFSSFWQQRQGDFVKLDPRSKQVDGPGPLLLAYNIPPGIDSAEIQDMIYDAAPLASAAGAVPVCRLYSSAAGSSTLWETPLATVLAQIMAGTVPTSTNSNQESTAPGGGMVLLFSGFRNDEMMAVYQLLSQEIEQELAYDALVAPAAACAKAVPKAMKKPLAQVLDEILGDHDEAVASLYQEEAAE
jgi:hypothetical protein